jgi:hypothetical protein
MSWELLHLGAEGEAVSLGGANIWTRPWKQQGEEPITVKHPAHPDQEHRLSRYFIEAGGKTHEFAATEVSPGVWLFMVRTRDAERSVLLYFAAYVLGLVGTFILVHGFERSPKYIALGSALLAMAVGAGWCAKPRRTSSEA